MSTWNKNRFSVFTSDEKDALGLIEELGKQTNDNSDALANKTNLTGNHLGAWQGLSKPTLSDEGMRATVEKLLRIGNVATDNLQNSLDIIKDYETVYINGEYEGEQFVLENKHNVVIIGSALLTQKTNHYQVQTMDTPISAKGFLRIVNCTNITFIGINIKSIYESIDVQFSENITFKDCLFDGINNTSKFNGFVARDCVNVTVENCKCFNFSPMPSYNDATKENNYSLGNGISAYNVIGFNVSNCEIYHNAQNGIYTFMCSNVTIYNNKITENGMSAIQFAFGKGNEKNYNVTNNIMINNYSDGVDINNTTANLIDINCTISNNYYEGNGWFNKDITKGTQDGSGVATLIKVQNVNGIGNIVKDSYRHSLYISACKDVNISYKADKSTNGTGTALYIGNSERVTISPTVNYYLTSDNAVAIDSTHGGNYNITIKDGYIYSDKMQPIYTKGNNEQENVKVINMTIVSNEQSLTAYGNIIFDNCKITSLKNKGCVMGDGGIIKNCDILSLSQEGIYPSNNSKIINCTVESQNGIGIVVWNKNNVSLQDCVIKGKNNGVRIDGTTKTLINCCIITGVSHGLHSNGAVNITVRNSTISSTGGSNSIRCENGTTCYDDNNTYNGPSDFTTATRKTVQWN